MGADPVSASHIATAYLRTHELYSPWIVLHRISKRTLCMDRVCNTALKITTRGLCSSLFWHIDCWTTYREITSDNNAHSKIFYYIYIHMYLYNIYLYYIFTCVFILNTQYINISATETRYCWYRKWCCHIAHLRQECHNSKFGIFELLV